MDGDMNTVPDLYEFLKTHPDRDIIAWLDPSQSPCWRGSKEKQESLMNLFFGLGLITKLQHYNMATGNFDTQTIKESTSWRDIFYKKNSDHPCSLSRPGDKADGVGFRKGSDKRIVAISAKNRNKQLIGGLDIEKIEAIFNDDYKPLGYTMSLCLCIRNCAEFVGMVKRAHRNNNRLKKIIKRKSTIIIDWDDLNAAYHKFKENFGTKPLCDITGTTKPMMVPRMHQKLGIMKTLQLEREGHKEILWGHTQRTGKSFIMVGHVIEHSKHRDEYNVLVITTAPTETMKQQAKDFACAQLEGFNIIELRGDNLDPPLEKKNIIICSKQFLDRKKDDKVIGWLHDMTFDMRFIDESHNGGTTERAQKMLECYGKSAFTVQITATYNKPATDFNIPRECWVLWDMEDIKLCKNITKEGSVERLVEKHGKDMNSLVGEYSKAEIIAEYSKDPDMHVLTRELTAAARAGIIAETKDNEYGWSLTACFLLNQSDKGKVAEFQNEKEVLKIFYSIFGKEGRFGTPDKDYPDGVVFMKRIQKICNNPEINSRFIGKGEFHDEPMIIMAFLPMQNISAISKALKKLLEDARVIQDYEIVSINCRTTTDPKKAIEDARDNARTSGKKGVLVLSGRQCSLGVTIDNCDIVLMLSDSAAGDMTSQMMFRGMTPDKNKKCGFVVDMNIQRAIEASVINYGSIIKPHSHPKKAAKYILQERIVTLNGDHWMPSFGHGNAKLDAICEGAYEVYSSGIARALRHLLDRLRTKDMALTVEENKEFLAMFWHTGGAKKAKVLVEEQVKKGIEKVKVDRSDEEGEEAEAEVEEKQINYMEILRHLIPLVCVLTIRDNDASFPGMFGLVKNDKQLYSILMDLVKTWWGDKVDEATIDKFANIYATRGGDDQETEQIIRSVKELFVNTLGKRKELSVQMDTYLVPQANEKKKNAEVSTPHTLRCDMLDKLPRGFWTRPRKVFEPCAGKGGFLIDIIDRFMDGLAASIPCEKERYRTIVEECLHFADINPLNIFVCRLLVDPHNQFKLNCHKGDTLKMDFDSKFDAVIGNPPYNASGNIASGNTIWQDFTKLALNSLLKEGGYLVYVHPPGWRKPNTKRGKFYGLYDMMTKDNQMVYLSMHDTKDGMKTFNCGTRYDWYVIRKTLRHTATLVRDTKGVEADVDMIQFKWLPNYNITGIQSITGSPHCAILQSMSAYEPRKSWMSTTRTAEHKYPCIHSTPKAGVRYMYSNRNDRGLFGVSKVIFGDGGIYNPVIDMKGEYGMTQHAMAIQVDSLDEAQNVAKAIQGEKFADLVKSCAFSSFAIDWNIFKEFKKDFWKDFV